VDLRTLTVIMIDFVAPGEQLPPYPTDQPGRERSAYYPIQPRQGIAACLGSGPPPRTLSLRVGSLRIGDDHGQVPWTLLPAPSNVHESASQNLETARTATRPLTLPKKFSHLPPQVQGRERSPRPTSQTPAPPGPRAAKASHTDDRVLAFARP